MARRSARSGDLLRSCVAESRGTEVAERDRMELLVVEGQLGHCVVTIGLLISSCKRIVALQDGHSAPLGEFFCSLDRTELVPKTRPDRFALEQDRRALLDSDLQRLALLACSAERSGRPARVPSVRANSGFSRRWNVSNFGTRDRGLRTEGAHLLTEAVGPQAKQL